MPGKNCSIPNCSTSRRHVGISIFDVPRGDDEFSTEWRKKLVGIITKYRVVDASVRLKIEKRDIAICEKHFTDDVKIFRKLELGLELIFSQIFS